MVNKGIDSIYTLLYEENLNLKGWLIDLQEKLNKIMEDKSNFIFHLKSKLKLQILKDINPKLFNLKKKINPDVFKIVLGDKVMKINKVFSQNIKRFTHFIDAFVDPSKIFEFLDKLKADKRVEYKLAEIKGFYDLYEIIIDWLSYKQDENVYDSLQVNEVRATAKFNSDLEEDTTHEIYIHCLSPSDKNKHSKGI